jgi:hypothetical protein
MSSASRHQPHEHGHEHEHGHGHAHSGEGHAFNSGSVALLADTIHNFSDALTAVPLWVDFILGRRAASRR